MVKVNKKIMVFAIIATIVFGVWMTVRIIKEVQFDMNCAQYIERAANASSIEIAKEELAKAISYAEENNMTEGVVSVFFHQPTNDVGYWYQNMTEVYDELEKIPEDATSLEKTNVLLKLRETLTDRNSSNVYPTIPDGISVYPRNVIYFWWGVISGIFCFVLWIKVVDSLKIG